MRKVPTTSGEQSGLQLALRLQENGAETGPADGFAPVEQHTKTSGWFQLFDRDWMRTTFNACWKHAQHVTRWTNARLQPPPRALEIFGAAQSNPEVAALRQRLQRPQRLPALVPRPAEGHRLPGHLQLLSPSSLPPSPAGGTTRGHSTRSMASVMVLSGP